MRKKKWIGQLKRNITWIMTIIERKTEGEPERERPRLYIYIQKSRWI